MVQVLEQGLDHLWLHGLIVLLKGAFLAFILLLALQLEQGAPIECSIFTKSCFDVYIFISRMLEVICMFPWITIALSKTVATLWMLK